MAVIKQRTFSTGVDQCLAIQQEEFLRPLGIGTDWITVRVSIQMAIDNDTLASFASGALQIGLCSGTAYPYVSTYTTNYIGLQAGGSNGLVAGNTWTYNLNAGDSYYIAQGWSVLSRTGTTTTMYATGSGTAPRVPIPYVALKRGFFAVSFTKGAPSFTINGTWWNTGTYPDVTPLAFIDGLDQAVIIPTIGGTAGTNASYSVPFSESNGVLDTISVYWNRMYPIEIYGIGVTRIA